MYGMEVEVDLFRATNGRRSKGRSGMGSILNAWYILIRKLLKVGKSSKERGW